MASGSALLVGLTSVDSSAYGGWDGRGGCYGCELDVANVERILTPLGFKVSKLITQAATASRILKALEAAAEVTQPEDAFVFYYSGHGGQQPDFDGDEVDRQDETLVAYDRQLSDDELNKIWPLFRPGARIVMISDSCNSGTNYRFAPGLSYEPTPILFPSARGRSVRAQLIHIGACRDSATSDGYEDGGLFTRAMVNTWSGGAFNGDYKKFYSAILTKTAGAQQKAQYNEYGMVSDGFRTQRPFTINASARSSALPSKTEIRDTLKSMPLSWLADPSLVTKNRQPDTSRLAPLAAAIIGVAVGAGIQLTSQALKRGLGSPSRNVAKMTIVPQSFEAVERSTIHLLDLASEDAQVASSLCAIVDTTARPLPIAVAAFLAGVAVGAAAAR